MRKLLSRLVVFFRRVQVYALVGKSGTGKSFRARLVMEQYNITMLIDDGLLIQNQRIIAGKSAKRETAYLAAVRTALFVDRDHRREVRHAIERNRFKRILVIGTSDRMIIKICQALALPEPTKIIRIEEIATTEEIQAALNHRNSQGRHVIPVPAIEVKRTYPRIMARSVKVIWERGLGLLRRDRAYEKTVVRPEFSQKGSVTMSETALSQMIMHCVEEFEPAIRIKRLSIGANSKGHRIDVHVQVPHRLQLSGSLYNLHHYIVNHVERFTGIIIDELNLVVDNVATTTYNTEQDGGS